ncbi:hypothetical protein [Streptomyces flavofungini]|uniref:hypothetical protein n=1 Tax=Streptomyces flavofungini TaxID=68200 RepID=UPI0025B14C08|nr:hypothetical protein [Streptomyces flavofungini]WJV51044.1 hypothetical protein QUY26_39445 [Streptomyces flavofungini]
MSASTFPNTQLCEFGYCVIVAKGISAAALLARVSDEEATPILLSRAEADAIPQIVFEEVAKSVTGGFPRRAPTHKQPSPAPSLPGDVRMVR